MSNTSTPWKTHEPTLDYPLLTTDMRTDVCVIGGGIAGLTTAYRLRAAGKAVMILDASIPGQGETGHTTGHLGWVVDRLFHEIASTRGDEAATHAAASHREAIADIEAIAADEKIDCDFARVDGYLFPGSDGPKALRKEIEAARRLSLDFDEVMQVPLAQCEGMRFPNQARLHIGKYMHGLATALAKKGTMIHGNTRVVGVTGGSTCKVETESGVIVRADAVVIAANAPFEVGLTMHSKVAAYTTYAVALPIAPGSVTDALYWDTEDPYHYVRIQPGDGDTPDLLIVGGEDHKTGQADDQEARWARLEAWGQRLAPKAGAMVYHWSGEVFETADGLGLNGAALWGENVYVITGDSGNGLTNGTLAGRLLADLITGRDNPYASLYSPSRWTPSAVLSLLSENANLAAQYRDWFTGSDVASVDDIPPGQGAIVRRGLTKVAVYRQEQGEVCERSAICPHMGAIVSWNPGEKTWDCPAHGSRFSCDGKVIHGPAVSDLEEKKKE